GACTSATGAGICRSRRVPPRPGRFGRADVTTATTSGSPVPAKRRVVCDLGDERLIGRFTSAEGKEAEAAAGEVDLGPDEPVEPVPIDRQAMAEDRRPAGVGRPAEEDEPTHRRAGEVELIVQWKRPPGRRGFDPNRGPTTARGD